MLVGNTVFFNEISKQIKDKMLDSLINQAIFQDSFSGVLFFSSTHVTELFVIILEPVFYLYSLHIKI